ncbi:unnamed protein product, partial [Brassica rapa]
QGIKVHATCRKNYLKSLGDKCIVGEWKTIENFQVSEPGKQFRPTKLMYKISFINQTVIKPNDFQNNDMFLALAEFDFVLSGSLETEFLIDIVGQAIDVGELRILHSNGKKLRKIEFTLRNVSDVCIQCCLWGKIADEMENHREEAQFGVVVEDPALLPECIKEIVGKTFRYGITFDKGGDTKFKVLKVWSVYNTLMVDSQSETMSGKGTTAISGSEVF